MKIREMRERLDTGRHTVTLWCTYPPNYHTYKCSRDTSIVDGKVLEKAKKKEDGSIIAAVSLETGKPLFLNAGFVIDIDGESAEEPIIIN